MESTIGQLFWHTKVGTVVCVGVGVGGTRATSVGGSNFDFQPLQQSFCLSLCVAQRSAIKKVDIRDSGHELPFLFILFTPHLGDARWLCTAAAASHEQAALHRSSSPLLSPANQKRRLLPRKTSPPRQRVPISYLHSQQKANSDRPPSLSTFPSPCIRCCKKKVAHESPYLVSADKNVAGKDRLAFLHFIAYRALDWPVARYHLPS